MKNSRTILKIFIVLILIMIIISFIIRGKSNFRKFNESNVNSEIQSYNDWLVNTREYYLESGLHIDIPINDTILKIGDSISKPANSLKFKIYRRDSFGKYQFYKEYDSDNY